MKKIAVVLLAFAGIGLSACNTIEGVGKDIKQGGAAIERAADKSK
ncbi:entericidin A/B family lipoprotein [Limnobacter humi]|uniref:Entericidin A/B family lipoprotein n=1 Tax=Limnobacter humi TaxID=1778671 RepID=A0ABT1WEA7_9BURK|nr:entericidin A/B family lipoprotein [Limnobacter humi]MCQ8895856.1 entericidin A/B family lipoprotein [Limnobacter humi]